MDEQDQTPTDEAGTNHVADVETELDDTPFDDTEVADTELTDTELTDAEPAGRRRRFSRAFATAALAGVVGLGIGAGAVALIGGHDHDRGDRQVAWDHHDGRGDHDGGHDRHSDGDGDRGQQGPGSQQGIGGQG